MTMYDYIMNRPDNNSPSVALFKATRQIRNNFELDDRIKSYIDKAIAERLKVQVENQASPVIKQLDQELKALLNGK